MIKSIDNIIKEMYLTRISRHSAGQSRPWRYNFSVINKLYKHREVTLGTRAVAQDNLNFTD